MLRHALSATVLALSLAGCCSLSPLTVCPVCPGSPHRPAEPKVVTDPMRPIVWRITRDSGHGPETIGLAMEPESAGTPWTVVHLPGVLPFRPTDLIDPEPLVTGFMGSPDLLCEVLRSETISIQNTLVVGPVFDLNQIMRTMSCPAPIWP